jgi:hypothetical protein
MAITVKGKHIMPASGVAGAAGPYKIDIPVR